MSQLFLSDRPVVRVATWLLLCSVLSLAGYLAGMETIIPGPAAPQTLQENPGERLAQERGIGPEDSIFLILSAEAYEVDSVQFVEARETLLGALRGLSEVSFRRIRTVGKTFFDESFISKDRKSLLIIADTDQPLDSSDKTLGFFPEFIRKWNEQYPWLQVFYLSQGIVNNEVFTLINRDLDRSLIYTLPLTLLVLLWAFRSLAAACIPLLLAVISLAASLGAAALLSHVIEPISAASAQLVVLLVLALGVDYSLFIISRVREELANGEDYSNAVALAHLHTGRAVFWSGITVALSLLGLVSMQDSILTSMALVSVVAVLVTLSGCLFVLPSLLLLVGEARLCGRGRRGEDSSFKGVFEWLVNKSLSYPIIGLLLSLILLGIPSFFAFKLQLGTTVEAALFPNEMQSRMAIEAVQKNFPALAGTDISVILAAPSGQKLETTDAVEEFFDQLLATDTLRGPVRVDPSESGQEARYEFVALGSANDSVNQNLIHLLRKEFIPHLEEKSGVKAYISGTLPYVVDEMERYSRRTPLVFGAVLVLSFLFLLVAFRSLVVPLKAIVLNILSTSVAFGALTLVFILGVCGRWHYGVIEAFVPALLYSILFGLSMDYHVLLLSRVQEGVVRGLSTKEAVSRAVLSTGRSITSAALIMVAVFAIVATLELPLMKELGVGLAVAVIIDATIIRIVLLPASMVLLNTWNWYLPRWLGWLQSNRFFKLSH